MTNNMQSIGLLAVFFCLHISDKSNDVEMKASISSIIQRGRWHVDARSVANCVKKKKSSYSCHSKIVFFFFFCCCTNCSTQRKELRLALISTMNEKLFDCRQQLIQQTPQLDRRVNKKFLWLVSTKVIDPWSHGLRQLLRGIISLKDNTYRGEGDKRF